MDDFNLKLRFPIFLISVFQRYQPLGRESCPESAANKPVELSFSELGMTENQQKEFQRALSQPQGLILVTGPTGSGKSISLYTALQWLKTRLINIL